MQFLLPRLWQLPTTGLLGHGKEENGPEKDALAVKGLVGQVYRAIFRSGHCGMWWEHPRHIDRQLLTSLWYNLYTSPLLITVALARACLAGCVEGQIQQALFMPKAEMALQLARLLQSTGISGHQFLQQDNLSFSVKPCVPANHLEEG